MTDTRNLTEPIDRAEARFYPATMSKYERWIKDHPKFVKRLAQIGFNTQRSLNGLAQYLEETTAGFVEMGHINNFNIHVRVEDKSPLLLLNILDDDTKRYMVKTFGKDHEQKQNVKVYVGICPTAPEARSIVLCEQVGKEQLVTFVDFFPSDETGEPAKDSQFTLFPIANNNENTVEIPPNTYSIPLLVDFGADNETKFACSRTFLIPETHRVQSFRNSIDRSRFSGVAKYPIRIAVHPSTEPTLTSQKIRTNVYYKEFAKQ